ncbi:MAG: hypothetical protein PHU69_02780 [Fermentimonas sp.]|nr:hypothetical protein [Fermentimonas sp.]
MNDWKTTAKQMYKNKRGYKKSHVQRIVPEMTPFYKGINSDYKNWNRNASD